MKPRILITILVVSVLLSPFTDLSAQEKRVRKPVVAGQFYPGTWQALEHAIQEYFGQATKVDLPGALHALIVPHAGYIYSGPIAAFAYKQINRPFQRVFILASNHSAEANFTGISVPNYTHYATPLGEVRVSPVVPELLQQPGFSSVPAAHATHVEEVQLPFLQTVLHTDFEIVPIITGRLTGEDIPHFGELLNQYVNDETLFIVSTDLSHYHPYKEAVPLDKTCIQALEQLDTEGVANAELCGQAAALIFLEIAHKQGWQGQILDYRNSGDTAGDKAQVVGYAAIAYYSPPSVQGPKTTQQTDSPSISDIPAESLTQEEQQMLLELAQSTIELYVRKHQVFEPDPAKFAALPKLTASRGTFVTLKKDGDLRGCIGSLIGDQPLYLGVRDNAINAAARDPRFLPVTEKELSELSLSISVLDTPTLFPATTPEEYLTKLTHNDGVILVSGNHRSTYLPQVWEELPDPVEFLSTLCRKGGANADCWKDSKTQVYTYHAQEFGAGE
jgi:MEMO1 family protein